MDLKKYLTEAWCLGPGPGHDGHQPTDRTIRMPKLLCGRCAVVRSVFRATVFTLSGTQVSVTFMSVSVNTTSAPSAKMLHRPSPSAGGGVSLMSAAAAAARSWPMGLGGR